MFDIKGVWAKKQMQKTTERGGTISKFLTALFFLYGRVNYLNINVNNKTVAVLMQYSVWSSNTPR